MGINKYVKNDLELTFYSGNRVYILASFCEYDIILSAFISD